MIIFKAKNIKSNFQETVEKYKKTLNFTSIKCSCGSTHLIKWGFYQRGIIYFVACSKIASEILKVPRIRCKSCGKTHSILPWGIIPYKQFTDEVVSRILEELTTNSIEKTSTKYCISTSVIKKFIKQFQTKHVSKIITLMKCHKIKECLKKFLSSSQNKIDYIIHYNNCFMQDRLGILVLCPS